MFSRKRFIIIGVLLVCVAAGALLYSKISIEYRHEHEGIYFLRGENGDWLSITDDLSPEDGDQILWGMALPFLRKATVSGACIPTDIKPCTHFEWNEESGRGFIKTSYPGGKKLVIALGRYIGSTTGKPVSGLFIGGGLPTGDPDYQPSNNNETGMTYFDGSRYFHIWCNVNEGIVDAVGNTILPSTYEFISSKVLEKSEHDVTIISKHRTMVNNVPVSIDRVLFYQTGDTFVTLTTTLTNRGKTSTFFRYVYGDEPWLGNFYTFSKGNIGWFKDGFITTEMLIDTSKYNYIGMFDYGNQLAGESHNYTGKANFLEWEPEERPDIAYISNQFGTVAPPEQKVPLSSYKSRVLSLEWGPKHLPAGKSFSFTLKVGMAENDPKTGFPVKQDTQLY